MARINFLAFWDGVEWRWAFTRGRVLRARDHEELENMQHLLLNVCLVPDGSDKLIWTPRKAGCFSVKSFYHELSKNSPSQLQDAAHILWKGLIPHRIEVYTWIALMEKLNIRKKLVRLNVIQPLENSCAFCGLDSEFFLHFSTFFEKVWAASFL